MKRLYRIAITALGFFTFGFLGIFFQFLIFPGIVALVHPAQRRKRLARAVIHKTFAWFIEFLRIIGVLKWRATGLEALKEPGQLILANHLTLIDVVFLFSFTPNACAIVKEPLAKNPFTWGALYAAGYIINRGGNELIEQSIKELREGSSLIIFPEGTRTPAGIRPKLKHGAMVTSLRSGISPTLVAIDCKPIGLSKEKPWWEVTDSVMNFSFNVLGKLDISPYLPLYQDCPPKATRALSRAIFDKLFSHYDNMPPA